MRKILSFIGGLCAFVTVLTYALVYLNATFSFLPTDFLAVLMYVKEFGALIVLAITGLEFVWVKKVGVLFVFIYLAVVAVVVVFMFFPGAAEQLVGALGK